MATFEIGMGDALGNNLYRGANELELTNTLNQAVKEYNSQSGDCYNLLSEEHVESIYIYDDNDSGKVMESILDEIVAEFNKKYGATVMFEQIIDPENVLFEICPCSHQIKITDKDGNFIAINKLPKGFRASCVFCNTNVKLITTKEEFANAQKEAKDR